MKIDSIYLVFSLLILTILIWATHRHCFTNSRAFSWSLMNFLVNQNEFCLSTVLSFVALSDGFFHKSHWLRTLRTPDEAFFQWYPKLLGLGRNILGHLGYFRPIYQHYLVLWVPCPWENGFGCFFSFKPITYIIPKNNIGRKEFGKSCGEQSS